MADLIDRQAAIDALNRTGDEILPGGILRGTVYRILENLPSAQPERKKGKWIQPVPRRNVLAYSLAYSECDQCHEVIYLGNEMKYCPNCGARMER